MSRQVAAYERVPHGRTLLANEPLVYHCNFYNYWLQKTLLLDEELHMEQVIADAATEVAYAALRASAAALSPGTREARVRLAQDLFAELGFGSADFSQLGPDGGRALFPVSHYGATLRQAVGEPLSTPQSHFDAGFAAAVAAFLAEKPADAFSGTIETCQARGAQQGLVLIGPRTAGHVFTSPGLHSAGGGQPDAVADGHVNEPGILQALSQLDLAGNEEGLIPRFGVVLTNHFANFYNRASFEFVHRMAGTGLLEAAESLLVDAGYRCAFHTFGGIMSSAEWDAVVGPQLRTREDWVHGMVAVINALGWGTWRIAELTPDHCVVRIWDDYESCGHLEMYGPADRPVSYLAAAGVAGMMNLIYLGNIQERPELSLAFYDQCFECDSPFVAEQTKSRVQGHAYTEITASRDAA